MADITREVATSGFLLRAYGFKNQEIYNILAAKGFDLTMFSPTSGAATQSPQSSSSKNLNKDLFTPKARKKVGGKRGAPSWLPAMNNLGDYLAQSLGFLDEAALDEFTLSTVGSLMAASGKSMGQLTSKNEIQRNLMQTADWEWTDDSTLMAGCAIDEHSMSDAIDTIKAGNNFDLAARVVGGPIVSPVVIPVPSGGSSTSSSSTTTTPSAADPIVEPELIDDDDDDIDSLFGPASPDPDDDAVVVGSADIAGHQLLSPSRPTPPVSDLPDPSKATRRLNKSVWDIRVNRGDQTIFGEHEVNAGPGSFYPCVGPLYIKLPVAFLNGVIPQKDVSIRSDSEVLPFETDWNDQTSDMILVLENGAHPYFYFEDSDEPPYFLKMSLSMSASDRVALTSKKCVCNELQIDWSDPGNSDFPSIPEKIKFLLMATKRPGALGRPYALKNTISGWTFLPSPDNATGATDMFSTTMENLVTQNGDPAFVDAANELRQQVAAGYAGQDYDDEEDLLLPIGDGIPDSVIAGSFTDTDSAAVLVYGIPNYGMAGLDVDPDAGLVFGKSLIFANEGVKVYTSIDQYQEPVIGIYESKFLANLPIDWATDSEVVWTAANPINLSLKMQLQFRDSGSTISDYSGINPEDPDGPRVQAIYIPGDVPAKINPISMAGQETELNSIAVYPKGATSVYERIRLTFVDADNNESYVEIPDTNDRFTGNITTATGNKAIITGEACLMQDAGEQGYIAREEHPDYDTREFMQLIQEARIITRASDLNNVIAAPHGNVKGVKQVIWSEGRTLNVLMLKPGSDDEFIHLTIVTEKAGTGE